jgi:hypothetical protein
MCVCHPTRTYNLAMLVQHLVVDARRQLLEVRQARAPAQTPLSVPSKSVPTRMQLPRCARCASGLLSAYGVCMRAAMQYLRRSACSGAQANLPEMPQVPRQGAAGI